MLKISKRIINTVSWKTNVSTKIAVINYKDLCKYNCKDEEDCAAVYLANGFCCSTCNSSWQTSAHVHHYVETESKSNDGKKISLGRFII
jgi:hypothetical protein